MIGKQFYVPFWVPYNSEGWIFFFLHFNCWFQNLIVTFEYILPTNCLDCTHVQ